MIDWADENNSAWSRAQRSFQSPNGSHFSPFVPRRKTSRSVVKIKSGRMGNSKSVRPDSSKSTERPVLMAKSAPSLCSSAINSMQCSSKTGSLTRETSVPSKSRLRRRTFIADLTCCRSSAREQEYEMKSAYELAMERLAKNQPIVTLSDDQKKQLAEVDSIFKARIAEKELFLKGEIQKAQASGKFEDVESLEKQLTTEIRRLQEDCEAKKEKLRASFAK